MTARVMQEIKRLQQDGPSEDLTNRAKETARRSYETALKQNDYWLGRLQTINTLDRNPGEILTRGTRIDAVTPQVLQDVFKQYFPADRSTIVTLCRRRPLIATSTRTAEHAGANRLVGRVVISSGSARQRAASVNTSPSVSPSGRSRRSSCRSAISASSAGPISSALVAAMSRQISGGLEASRVVSARPRPASASPSCADRVADHLHQRARGQLRQMAEERQQPIVLVDVDDPRHARRAPATNADSFSTRAAPVAVAGRRQQPRPAAEEIRPRVLEAALRGAAERMAADEREARRQQPRGVDDRALGAAGVGDDRRLTDVLVELREQRDVLPHRRREDHDVGLGQHDQVVGRDVDRVQPHRRLEHVLVVDADDQRLRPDLPRRQRDRSADQAEADDADLLEDGRLPARRAAGPVG